MQFETQTNIVPDNSAARAVPTIPGPNDLSKKQIVSCPHTDRRYYAKGMCVNCYHRRGRTKKAWNCPHTRKTHYSKGLCKYCYLASYYKSRTTKRPAGYSNSNASIDVVSEAAKETIGLEKQPNDDAMAVEDTTILNLEKLNKNLENRQEEQEPQTEPINNCNKIDSFPVMTKDEQLVCDEEIHQK